MFAAQAVGMMFAVTTRFRASCRDLMEQTAITCDSVAAGGGSPGRDWLETGVGLVSSYEDNLEQIRNWTSARRLNFADLDETIPGTLPASADVDSPDFRYENFRYPDHVPADYAPEVERERQRYSEEQTKPDGVISERLAGEG